VRTEIARALSRGIRVIPVLVSGATMPQEIELPADLISLSKRQAFQLEDRYWKQGFRLLAESLDDLLAGIVKISGSKQWVWRYHVRAILTVFVDGKELSKLELFGCPSFGPFSPIARKPARSASTTTSDVILRPVEIEAKRA
jgi:hypothetical protein